MFANYRSATAVLPGMPADEAAKRRRRWRFFQVAFVLTYVGIILDIFTTNLGFQKAGVSYEQNPLGGSLIGHLGWIGLAVVMTILCEICYVSVRTVAWRKSPSWIMLFNILIVPIALFRWLAVITAIIYLRQG